MGILQHIRGRIKAPDHTINIVSGLPRSGTSMMMKMIEAGGIEPFMDNVRIPDNDNPGGYYESERVKKLSQDSTWLHGVRGRVIKIISMLLFHLPPEYKYRVIFMLRDMDEIMASQSAMLIRKGKKGSAVSDEELAVKFFDHLKQIELWLHNQPNIKVLYINYNEILKHPWESIIHINKFMDQILDETKMTEVIDSRLYRQRRCL